MGSLDELQGLKSGIAKLESEIRELERTLRLTRTISPDPPAVSKIIEEIQRCETLRKGFRQELSRQEPDFWRGLHREFQALATEEQALPKAARGDGALRADCTYREHTPECGQWILGEGPNENFRARFDALPTRAGVGLGSPSGTEPLDFWLHRLFRDLLENKSHELLGASDEGGMILRLCGASATFCSRLEKKALETNGVSKRSTAIVEAEGQQTRSTLEQNKQGSKTREAFLRQILHKKGFSVHGWAVEASVDFHTADDFLKGKRKPYPDTLKKLADALGIEVAELPE